MVLYRIKTYLDYKGITVSAFERSVGMSNGSFGKSLKSGGSIGVDKVESILEKYPDLSAEWLLRGRGEMLCDAVPSLSDEDHQLVQLITEFAEILNRKMRRNEE